MRSATGVREPLSNTITSRGGSVCEAIESRQASSISPPSMSSTITETSVMLHPVEVRGAVEAAQPHAAIDRHVDVGIAVGSGGGRQNEGPAPQLDRCTRLRLVAQRRWS